MSKQKYANDGWLKEEGQGEKEPERRGRGGFWVIIAFFALGLLFIVGCLNGNGGGNAPGTFSPTPVTIYEYQNVVVTATPDTAATAVAIQQAEGTRSAEAQATTAAIVENMAAVVGTVAADVAEVQVTVAAVGVEMAAVGQTVAAVQQDGEELRDTLATIGGGALVGLGGFGLVLVSFWLANHLNGARQPQQVYTATAAPLPLPPTPPAPPPPPNHIADELFTPRPLVLRPVNPTLDNNAENVERLARLISAVCPNRENMTLTAVGQTVWPYYSRRGACPRLAGAWHTLLSAAVAKLETVNA